MQRFLIGSLSTLVLLINFLPAQAQNVSLTPFNLVNLARNGYFQEQGIPSFGGLEAAIKSGQVSAEDIIQAAIQERRLSSEHLNNPAYIQSVKRLLNDVNID
ncbi:MAG: hypothetical protein HC879_19330 [Leptolyngbyaceae cyanobacterium SL_5_9]|nr:hypothetical protein [Leptolyngbyaceae cyanobacterium SL_5_9]NJO75093.1 hypothetical protein [Leptolyngbyaceae cyanobacterium RM1_406_9]